MRDAAAIALILLCLGFTLEILSALAPILLGFFGAYLVAPAVHWLEHRGISRGWVVFLTSVLATTTSAVAFAFLVPRLVNEISHLQDRVPKYLEVIRAQTGFDASQLWQAIDFKAALGALDSVQPLLGMVGSVLGTTAYGMVFAVLLVTSFTVFNLELEHLPLLGKYIPKSQRERLEPIVQVVTEVFQGFLRGQLLVMLFTGTIYTIGFSILGVPYGVVAALVGGVFSIIPYGQLSGPLLAVLFNLLESEVTGEFSVVHVFVLPALVYAIMQSLESFVITPLVQGAATRLHPLAILACLAAGGSIGGILGVFLAIPVTASVWLVAKSHLFPAWRDWAERH